MEPSLLRAEEQEEADVESVRQWNKKEQMWDGSQMETGWIAAAKSAAAARDADGHRDRSFFQKRADLDASHCDLEQNRGSCESIKRARHRAGSRH